MKRFEAIATGAWLGMIQVLVGFGLVTTQGGHALLFFAMIAAWLVGGVVGAALGNRPRVGLGLLIATLVLFAAGTFVITAPLSLANLICQLSAAVCGGSYAAFYLANRSGRFPSVAGLLFHENNGFVCGYVLASLGLLVLNTRVLAGIVVAAGLLLGLWQLSAWSRRPAPE